MRVDSGHGQNDGEVVGFAILQILLGASVIFTIPAYADLPFVFLELFKPAQI